MIASRDVFNPEYLRQPMAPRDGNNLDVEFRKAFAKVEDALVAIMIKLKGSRDIRTITNRSLVPLLSAGVISQDILDRYHALAFYGKGVQKSGEMLPIATPTRSRYIKPKVDDRMAGSCLPLTKGEMKLLLKECGSLQKKLTKIK